MKKKHDTTRFFIYLVSHSLFFLALSYESIRPNIDSGDIGHFAKMKLCDKVGSDQCGSGTK